MAPRRTPGLEPPRCHLLPTRSVAPCRQDWSLCADNFRHYLPTKLPISIDIIDLSPFASFRASLDDSSPRDPELADLEQQRPVADVEQTCGLTAVSAGLGQGAPDQPLFQAACRLLDRELAAVGGIAVRLAERRE